MNVDITNHLVPWTQVKEMLKRAREDGYAQALLDRSANVAEHRTEYGIHHVFDPNTWVNFETLSGAIEWLTEKEDPHAWRFHERQVTPWEEVE